MSEKNPELEVLLQGIESQEGREAVIHAYNRMSDGDDESIPVQFALVVKAQALLIKHSLKEFNTLASSVKSEKLTELEELATRIEKSVESHSLSEDAITKVVSNATPTFKDLTTLSDNLKATVSHLPRQGGGGQGKGWMIALLILSLSNTAILLWLCL